MKTDTNSHCPRCGTYLDISYLCIGLGEYGEYLDEKFNCPHCGAELKVNTENIDVISFEE